MTLREKFETKSSIDTVKKARVFANKCEKIAPNIVPIPKSAPSKVVLGIKINIEAINSTTPDPILP